MQIVNFKVNKFNAVLKDGKPELKVEQVTKSYLVASTKSANIIKDELVATGFSIIAIDTKNVYIDEKKTTETIEKLVNDCPDIPAELRKKAVTHLLSGFNKVCAFERKKEIESK